MDSNKLDPILLLAAAVLVGAAYALTGSHATNKVIKITALMFEYSPARIELKKGQAVTLQLTSLDRIHGFNIPQLGLRADVLPGQTVHVELQPEEAGRYIFLCDLFCGSGHDEMNGMIVVKD
jgi:cytochrome c oxidase subunit 2